MKKTLALLLAFAMMLTMLGAMAESFPTNVDANGVDYSAHVNADGKTFIRVSMDMDPGTYDPALFGSVLGLEATGYCFREGLFERNVAGELIPMIAKSYTVDEDNLTYHVEIYDYVTDSMGNPITAEDVAFCFTRAKEKGFNSTGYYDSVVADDPTHVTIHMNNSSEGMFAQVAQVNLIYSKAFFDSCGDDFGTTVATSAFTGPYKLLEWNIGTSLIFEKNDNYWQKPELRNEYAVQNVDRVEFYIVGESTQLSIGLETGTIDLVGNIGATDAGIFEGSTELTVTPWLGLLTKVIYLNMDENSPFYDNLPLRQAVMNCIDIDDMIAGILGESADGTLNGLAARTFGNSLMPDYQSAWDTERYFDYDPDFAKQCVQESGFTGTLRIISNNNPTNQMIAQVLQGYLAAIGINSECVPFEGSLFQTYKYDTTQYEICVDQLSWSGPSVTKWRDQFDENNSQGCLNAVADAKFQELLHTAMDVTTYSPEAVNEFHQYLKDQCYARGLFNAMNFAVSRNIVTSVKIHRSGNLFPTGCEFVWNEK